MAAHRKLVLKCHPDKVQDAALKAIKQDEFQKVQQAYELLSDDTRRSNYDDQVKLFELRKEMGRGVPTSRSNPFEFEVKIPTRPKPTPAATYAPPPSAKTYERPIPRSYEDIYEPPRATARASKSQEYERKRPSVRDDERLRKERRDDEERDREREREREKDRARYEKDLRRAEKSKKKEKESKDRKKNADDKYARAAYVEESSDDYHTSARPRATEKKSSASSKQRMEEDIRARNAEAAQAAAEKLRQDSERTRKMNDHKDFAAQYMQAARRKVQPPIEEEFEPRRPLQRAETYAVPPSSYNIRYATPTQPAQYSDDDTPRRSSARSSSRRASEATKTSSSRTRDTKVSSKESRRSPPTARDAYIVEPPSPPPIKKPSLQSHSSAPPTISRKEPARSKTMEPQFIRKESVAPPPLPRAQTFQAGDRGHGSKLKQARNMSSDDSDSDAPVYTSSKVRSPSPPKYRHAAPEPTRYIIDNGRSVPVRAHRSELREESYSDPRDRSESPRGGRHPEQSRPPITRSGGTRQAPRSSSHSQAYYTPDPPEPVIVSAPRPKMAPRESSYRGSSVKVPTASYQEVKYAPSYGPEHVVYTPTVPDQYRRAETARGYDSYPSVRGERVGLYA
ncbi:molecular chaperone DnaJ [Phlyctema vagabunda]|uniref:Molecular chaperone DnaJ n=1 Tax=Phlyctema vagabunda TaxID=108571 RepID=A0ABR4PPG0_9HELO